MPSPLRAVAAKCPSTSDNGLRAVARVATYLVIFSIPIDEMLPMPSVGTASRVLGIVAFGLALLGTLGSSGMRPLRLPHKLMLLFVGWSAITVLWSPVPEESLQKILTYAQCLGLVWLIWELAWQSRERTKLLQAYVLGCTVSALTTVHSYLTGVSYGAEARYSAVILGPQFDPNEAAITYALATSILIYMWTAARRGQFPRGVVVALFGLMVFSVGLTGSRGGLLALGAGILLTPLWAVGRRRKVAYLTVVTLLLGIGVAAFTFVPAESLGRLSTIRNELEVGSIGSRRIIWGAGLAVFKGAPIIGVGVAGYGRAIAPIYGKDSVAHNSFLSVLVETGIVGFSIYMLLLVSLASGCKRSRDSQRFLALTLLAVWCVGASSLTWEYRKPAWLVFAFASLFQITAVRRCGDLLRGRGRVLSGWDARSMPAEVRAAEDGQRVARVSVRSTGGTL